MGPGGKDAAQPQVRIIEHADVKRMLLAQKAYCEGALALELYCARLVDEQHTGDPGAADDARLLLEVLTPIAKSWPSEWCLEANSLAIQIHGGYGYTRDFPVEQYWRDNRLNMIHEGTHGIQAMDLLGRKVLMEEGRACSCWPRACRPPSSRRADCRTGAARQRPERRCAMWAPPRLGLGHGQPDRRAGQCRALHAGLRPYRAGLDLAGRGAGVAREGGGQGEAAHTGRLAAARYFFHYELPKIGAWLKVVESAT
jgi:hypothetical protein